MYVYVVLSTLKLNECVMYDMLYSQLGEVNK